MFEIGRRLLGREGTGDAVKLRWQLSWVATDTADDVGKLFGDSFTNVVLQNVFSLIEEFERRLNLGFDWSISIVIFHCSK